MNRFWPKGLSVTDAQSPDEILEAAREEWEDATEGVLTLVFQKSEPEDGKVTITVHVKHLTTNRTVALFSVIHRQNEPYPVTMQPKDEKIPKILKKSYYVSGISVNHYASQIAAAAPIDLEPIKETKELVVNEWVADTPSEFREKLTEAFNLSVVKSAVLNLTSSASSGVQSEDNDNAAQE